MIESDTAHEQQILARALDQLAVSYQPEQLEQVSHYLDLLQKWNATFNLSAIRDRQGMLEKHVLDSLSILPALLAEINERDTLIDIGTGAGLPAFFIALFIPSIQVTALDSAGKKIRFLEHVVRALKIRNLTPVNKRVENESKQFDHIVSRAFADLDLFINISQTIAHKQTRWWAMKGPKVFDELRSARFTDRAEPSLGNWLREQEKPGNLALRAHCHDLHVPNLDSARYLLEIHQLDAE